MKKIFVIIAFVSFSLHGFAQEIDKKFKPIPAKNAAKKEVVPPKEEAPKENPPAPIEKPAPLQVNPDELFKNTNLYKPEANVEGIFYRRNQFLGNINTTSATSTVMYGDAPFVY